MRASRLLSILTTLQARGQVSAQALAEECEVSLRTIYRDVEALSAAGIPIYSVPGSGGGYRLLDGYRVRLNGLMPGEADALFLAGLAREAAALGLGPVAARVRAKLVAALPEGDRAGALQARFHFDAPSWFAEPEAPEALPALAEAVRASRAVSLAYRSRSGEGVRRVEPLGIVLKGGAWYLVARTTRAPRGGKTTRGQPDGGDLRTFRIARVDAVTMLDDRFERPAGFDLAAVWAEASRAYERDLHPHRAEIRLSPRGLAMMDDVLTPAMRAGAETAAEAGPDGWRRVSLLVGAPASAALDILRFGRDAEVIGPPALRAEMASIAAALSHLYGAGPAERSDGGLPSGARPD